ncbi:molybdopterin synthase sulfur carrier subunit [Peribacillus deserti]|uniref:Molybdopterin synthase sulfur carrier subunit n=1 Tax=Peribacillus deserti TaxID=673318 RepID=A0ABS2QBS4_9BACI|nr:molybdopterin converting factor subunit 1 [Peribacillus deserti]MBM7690618.1 molybdopterin synthase sulfur carrier subunit [Peribacillus deserti]
MIKVLFFAHLKDSIGADSITLQMSGESISSLKKAISEQYKVDSLHTVMAAVNEEFADESTILADGDIVALIPPVSGG